MRLGDVSPLILTYNEAPNIGRCLERLGWAKDIVVVDSVSTDETIEVIGRYPRARLFQRRFDAHANQWNYGLKETGIGTEWVLGLDADYEVTDELVQEMRAIEPGVEVSAYYASFVYKVFGRPLRSGVYPPVAVLFRKKACDFVQDGHTHRLRVNEGVTGFLKSPMVHDDRKPLRRWLCSQSRYMDLEAEKLLHTPNRELGLADRLRKKIILAPLMAFAYSLIAKRGILDGWAGWHYAFQRMIAEGILSLKLIEKRLTRSGKTRHAKGTGGRKTDVAR